MASFNSVAVIGAGAWGTALAAVAARAGREVTLYARDARGRGADRGERDQSETARRSLHAEIVVTNDLALAAACDVILLVTPAQALRDAVDGAGATSRRRQRR